MTITTGTYYPNKPGATSLKDARQMYIGNEHVTANVHDGTVAVFVGLRIAYQGPVPASVTNKGEFYTWVIAVAETFAAAPVKVETRKGRDYTGCTETEIANLKGARYLAAFVDSNYGMPYDDREHELISSIEHAKRELWTRAVRNNGRTRYVDTVPNADTFTFFPCVTDEAEILLYAFEVVDGEIQRAEYPDYRVFMGPRGGIRVERV